MTFLFIRKVSSSPIEIINTVLHNIRLTETSPILPSISAFVVISSYWTFLEEVLLYSLVPIIQPSLHLDKRFRHFGCAWHTKELVGCPHRFLVGASPSTLTCISSTSLQFQPQPQPHFTSPHHSHLLFILLLNFSSLVPPSPQFYIVYVNPHIS